MKAYFYLPVVLSLLYLAGPCYGQFELDSKMALSIDASTYLNSDQSIVFFNGEAVQHYSLVEENEPIFSNKSIADFPEWEVISAALPWQEGEILLFQDQNYIVYNTNENGITQTGTWDGLPVEWNGGLDAACQWGDDTFLFFYGTEVVSYNSLTDTYDPVDLIINWDGWPNAWASGIDSAVNIGSGMVYFFRGPAYIAFDMETGTFDNPIRTSSK